MGNLRLALWLLGLVFLSATAPKAEPEISLSDDFIGPRLNRSIWTTRQIDRSRYRIDARSLKISTRGGDNGCVGDLNPCQRNEVRVRQDRQISFGTEAWYGFSFRVDGTVDPKDSNRLVIGQWKEQSEGSPFIAQRFDNRIFRITVQAC